MKTIDENATASMTEEEVEEFEEQFEWVDWKDTNGIFDAFERQLEKHGLELVHFDSGSDSYAFKVEKKAEFRVIEYHGDFPLPNQEQWHKFFSDLEEAKAVAEKKYNEVAEVDAGEEDFEEYEVVVQNIDGDVFYRIGKQEVGK